MNSTEEAAMQLSLDLLRQEVLRLRALVSERFIWLEGLGRLSWSIDDNLTNEFPQGINAQG